MTSSSPDTVREPAQLQHRLAGPLLFSAGLHGVVLLLVTRMTFIPSTEERAAEERQGIRVVFAERPQRSVEPEPSQPEIAQMPPAAATELDGEVTAEPVTVSESVVPEATATATVTEGAVPEATESATIAGSVVPDAGDLQAVAESVSPDGPALRQQEAPDTADAGSGTSIDAWTPARVRAAVQTSISGLRGNLTAEWLSDCILEQKERNTRDCEQHLQEPKYLSPNAAAGHAAGSGTFAGVTRSQRHWLREERFMKDNDAIRALVNEGGIVGELAAERFYLNREHIAYLSGNRGDLVFAPMQNFSADVLGGPRLLLKGGMPVECRSKRFEIDYGLDVGGVSFGNAEPCVYEFTGFNVERPEMDPDAFRVVPTVFGSRR